MNQLTRIILIGAQVVGRSLMRAWKEAGDKAVKEGGRQAASRFRSKAGDISVKESLGILNVDPSKPLTEETIEERFKHLFEQNDPKKGGSFYLQSKVMCAKIRLQEALQNKEEIQ
eukprot:TRINITY_DN9976_c0_g1_i1.p4 TRINITY_DN9976_c0_g1~~TRINITY_DN9976_c0_g1_i1.p4  ORF type:complete len:115 (-),score=48.41 TRINITY_DN9976_c0_g1_i1:374-718(-)